MLSRPLVARLRSRLMMGSIPYQIFNIPLDRFLPSTVNCHSRRITD